jgi:putative colanic acid biosynthesis acetyltransferase WcaF
MVNNLKRNRLSLTNKLVRTLWNIVWILLFRPTPRLFHAWRSMLLKLFGAKLGKSAHVYPTARIWAPWNLELGDYSCIGEWVDCYCVDKVRIGNHSTVSQYSFLCTASHDFTKLSMPLISAPIEIGSRVWITADVFVGPGVVIGDGVVVTARSSVFTDIPAWSVAKGTPAKSVRKRLLENE